ncbi:hypothetical protein NX059_012228 [Plenodomus lindquistii]|nr:hypothetical protein NX059_012228 [Plenodomus lindquistii]
MANVDLGDRSTHHSPEDANHNGHLTECTTSGAIGAHDDDMVIVGADGLQLFEMETGTDSGDPAEPQEQMPWLKLCLPTTPTGCETLCVYLNIDEPEAEAKLFRKNFIPAYRTRAQLPTVEQLSNEVIAFHTATTYILAATSADAAMRTAILGGNKSVKRTGLIAWMHRNVVHRHQARALAASPNLRCSLPGLRDVAFAACQILRGCEIQRPTQSAAHNNELYGDDASNTVEFVSMTRKGLNTEGGAGEVQTRWTGAAPVTDAPSFQVRDVCNRVDLALLVVDFGDLVMDVTIEKNLERAFTQRLPDLLRTSSRDGRVSSVVMQALYQAVLLHHEASQELSFRGSSQEYAYDVACYMLNEWNERYHDCQKDADMAEHMVFIDAVFHLASYIDIHIRYDGPVHVLEARGSRG